MLYTLLLNENSNGMFAVYNKEQQVNNNAYRRYLET
ncbi:hypothetical protein HMPREF9447_00257 [Bacteroides oleiciplenus YIT 12058]|uniref:Uncharacterized protein n=1 Tax=Bacteroides oleiciplenus YIT 12058 TaxID=742727 RepID=K9ETR8_9BACE|nr:hypothetical protein HMPREF9447_00257 [Bacteroides oleiciplenus YIT 12058]